MDKKLDLRIVGFGWEVEFRCGGRATIKNAWVKGSVKLDLGCGGCELWWHPDGRWTSEDHPLDIVALHRPPLTEAERLLPIGTRMREIRDRNPNLTVHDYLYIIELVEGQPHP